MFVTDAFDISRLTSGQLGSYKIRC